MTRHEIDRLERVARRLARRQRCTHLTVGTFCAQEAEFGLLCSKHFQEAFSQGLVLH